MQVNQAVSQRISTRAFLNKPISKSEIIDWLNAAQRSPSGGNLQPWKVRVVSGDSKEAIVKMAGEKLASNPAGEPTDRPIYPLEINEPYNTRRRRIGHQMFEKLGIERSDKVGRIKWMSNNFTFFNAPVGLFFVIDENMGHGQWAHTGMFMQTLALLAEERGWATCMQECWALLRTSLKEHFQLEDNEMIYCGMAVGYADKDHPVNSLRAERADIDEIAKFYGFQD